MADSRSTLSMESANLIGDVPALILIGVVLLVLMRRNK